MRCSWAENADATMQAYHDTEWGVPHHDDRALFELITLEGAQAGLSWRTVLARRDAYRDAFHHFDIDRVAAMSDEELTNVLTNTGVVRHRQKIWSVRDNAMAAASVVKTDGSLDTYLWSFVDGEPIVNHWREASQVPAKTELSDRLSSGLRERGFSFVGSTICYALMQASGMIDDHLISCTVKGTH
jgi:DNA-3-methyladenine glycosylase I